MQVESVVKSTLLLIASVVLFWALHRAQVFLVPLGFGAVFAMLLLPVCSVLESWGLGRVLASLGATLAFVAGIAALLFALAAVAETFTEDLPQIKNQVVQQYERVRETVQRRWGVPLPEPAALQWGEGQEGQENATAPRQGGGLGAWSFGGFSSIAEPIVQLVIALVELIGGVLLSIVSTFAFLVYRGKLREFVVRVTPIAHRGTAHRVIDRSSRVGLDYIWGQVLLVFVLAVLYAAGFELIGLRHGIFLAVFTAVFSLIPYIGNMIGILLPITVGMVGGGFTMVLWILAVFAIAQFFESYILEPMLVGSEVKLNPFITLLVVTGGGLLWGIPGLILAVPVIGIARVVCANIGALQPLAFLLGEEERSGGFFVRLRRFLARA